MDTDRDHRDAGTETLDDARQAGRRLGDEATDAAQDVYDRARSAAGDQAERGKSAAAAEIGNVADALRKAAGDMREGSPQERTFGQIADTLADASEAIRDRDIGQIAGDVSEFARRNPLAFLGAAALAGFAVTRFAKASQSMPRSSASSDVRSPLHGTDGAGSARPTSAGVTRTGRNEDAVTRDAIPGPVTRPVRDNEGTAPATRTRPVTTLPEDRS